MTELTVGTEHDNQRLDAYLAAQDSLLSRSAAQRLIEEGAVAVNGAPAKASHRVRVGEVVCYSIPPPKPVRVLPERLPLDVVYEDEHLLVLNKPRGMVVHPAPGSPAGTLVNALLAHCESLPVVGGYNRPGIVHRLDKDTTGLMVVAKNDAAHRSLQKQIQARTAGRRYLALVWGDPRFDEAVVDAPIGRHPVDRKKMAVIETPQHKSRAAVTELRVSERLGPMTLIEANLKTGRTHQVRVHSAYAGHPVVGDPVYSGSRRVRSGNKHYAAEVNRLIDSLGGQALHAYRLSFRHPHTGETAEFTAPMPYEMQALVDFLRRGIEA